MASKRASGIGIACLVVALVAAAWWWQASQPRQVDKSGSQRLTVAIAAIVEIPPIAELREGFQSEFRRLQPGREIRFEQFNAQGDPSLVNQVVDQLVASPPDFVFALGTPIAQAIQKRAPDLLVIQGGVTDPVEAGLAASWEASGRSYAATSDLPPVQRVLELVRAVRPGAVRLGAVYNPGEANSAAVIKRLRAAGAGLVPPLEIVDAAIASSRDVPSAVDSLVGRVDALFLPPDNTAAAAMDVIARIARDQKLPFFATASSVLTAGALAVVSVDYRELGVDSARLASRILAGANPAGLPIELPSTPSILVNKQVAAELGIDIQRLRAAFPQMALQ